MGYLIEIYLDKRHKHGNIENQIIKYAIAQECERFYENHEIQ